jgi:hypothetical protein
MSTKSNNVASAVVDTENKTNRVFPMLVGEIPGATVNHHSLLKGDTAVFTHQRDLLRIFFVIEGTVEFKIDAATNRFDERVVYVPSTEQDLTIKAISDLGFIEIQWVLTEADIAQLQASDTEFPIRQIYSQSEQYKDFFKSDKTISRSIIGQHALPRFCMGSVESYGFDRVEQHAHPLLDQFFFSFPENDVDLLIDDYRHPMVGDTLLHIPLGSNHGVEVAEGKKMHYLWIDFIFDAKGVAYLDEVHKSTGTMRNFDQVEK